MRASTLFLLLALALLCAASFVCAQDAAATTEPVEATQAPDTVEAPTEDKPDPWKPTKLTGLSIGENAALPVPVPILIAIFLAFVGAIAYATKQIFEFNEARERKEAERAAKREAKKSRQSSSKKKAL